MPSQRSYTLLAGSIIIAAVMISATLFASSVLRTTVTRIVYRIDTPCGGVAKLMAINSTTYCATEVSKDIQVGNPGYSYFLNGSITFMGVRFQTICPAYYSGCPGWNVNSTTVAAGAIRFTMTFPDKSTESTGAVIGDLDYLLMLSRHVDPSAGMQIRYITGLYGTGTSTSNYQVLLLVQAPPTSTSTVSTTCSITGQPGAIFLRILSDSTQTPVVGALVVATNQPALCNNSPATNQATVTFTTNATEWYPLSSDNNTGYSFIVKYAGQNYTFTANLEPFSVTCATFFIPSGKTSITTTPFYTTCK